MVSVGPETTVVLSALKVLEPFLIRRLWEPGDGNVSVPLYATGK